MSTQLPEERIKQIAERESKAPIGPWTADTEGERSAEGVNIKVSGPDRFNLFDTLNAHYKTIVIHEESDEDSRWFYVEGPAKEAIEFAAHARKDIPDLLQEIQRLKAELALAHGRVSLLEDSILEASVHICESSSTDDKAAMKVFGKVMDEAAMKRLGV